MHSKSDRALQLLWGVAAATNRGPKPRWRLDDVVATAVGLADKSGLEAVSLGRVANELAMTTTAFYRYADSKATLLELMVDAAIGAAPQLAGHDWQDGCRSWVHALADRYAEHPWLSDIRPTGIPRQPHVYSWIDALLRLIPADTGIDAPRLAMLLDTLVRNNAALARSLKDDEPAPWLTEVVTARFPALGSLPTRESSDPGAELAYAVEIVLRGLTQLGEPEQT